MPRHCCRHFLPLAARRLSLMFDWRFFTAPLSDLLFIADSGPARAMDFCSSGPPCPATRAWSRKWSTFPTAAVPERHASPAVSIWFHGGPRAGGRTQSWTFRDGDLLVNKDGLRVINKARLLRAIG